MRVTWYPRNIAFSVVLLATFAAALHLALGFRAGTIVGVLALMAYVGLETILTSNSSQWSRDHR